MIPVYLSELGLIQTLQESTVKWMSNVSFAIMIFALLSGAFIVLRALWKGVRAERKNTKAAVQITPQASYK